MFREFLDRYLNVWRNSSLIDMKEIIDENFQGREITNGKIEDYGYEESVKGWEQGFQFVTESGSEWELTEVSIHPLRPNETMVVILAEMIINGKKYENGNLLFQTFKTEDQQNWKLVRSYIEAAIPTGDLPKMAAYHPPKHVVAVTGYITNTAGEVLLVRNLHRSDTMEMPGGQVEEGETLEDAIHREIMEETGVTVRLTGITGLYQNVSNGVICAVFKGEYVSGEARPAEGETSEAAFVKLTKDNINLYITRPYFSVRVLDAMEPTFIPFQAYQARPYEILSQFTVKKE